MNHQTPVTRRGVMQAIGLGTALAATGGLAGCSKGSSGGAGKTEMTDYPSYTPLTTIPKPDLPGNDKGVQPVYFSYPEDKFQSVKGQVGNGSTISAMVITYGPPPPPMASNRFWQWLNKETNVTYQPQVVSANDYATKFAAVMAGGSIPDIIQVPVFMNLPRLPQLARSQFTDLAEYLSGDAVKKYPNLANIPQHAWVTSRIDGRIYGTPTERPPFGGLLYQRQDIIEQLKLNHNPESKEEFLELCKALTDPAKGRYALAGYSTGTGINWNDNVMKGLFGVPHRWKEENGKLIAAQETEEAVESLEFVRKTWELGYWHPDTVSMQLAKVVEAFYAGKVCMREDGPAWWLNQAQHTDIVIDAMMPFSANGKPPANYRGLGSFSFAAIKKGTPKEKIEEILRFMDYCAAPFGSKEFFNNTFGIEGHNWKKGANGAPVLTPVGQSELGIGLNRICSGPQVQFSAMPMDDGFKRFHALQQKLVDILVDNPTAGLYSETATRSASATQQLADVFTAVVVGRSPISAYKEAVKKWKDSVGDKIRGEYEEQLAATK